MDDATATQTAGTVENFGIEIGNAMGWPRMAGRVLATLMLHDGPMSMKQLQETLGASAGAISEMARLLDRNGVVTRVKIPNTRQIGYEYRHDAWLGCLQHQIAITTQLLRLAESSSGYVRVSVPFPCDPCSFRHLPSAAQRHPLRGHDPEPASSTFRSVLTAVQ